MLPDFGSEFWLWQLIGKLHPLAVHFPIGLLVTVLFLEALTLGGKRTELRTGIRWLVYIGAGSALMAAVQGWMLAADGSYGSNIVEYHRWIGTSTAVLAFGTACLLYRAQRSGWKGDLNAYRGALAVSVICLAVAGHFGAMLTHGRDYITSAFPWNQPPSGRAAGPETAELLANLTQVPKTGKVSTEQMDRLNLAVRGVFAHNCFECHSSDKQENGLRLDNRDAVMRGGDGGPIFVAGQPDQSEIMRRLRLPRDHDDAMPPEGRSIAPEEIELIGAWIDLGAYWPEGDTKTFREAELKPRMPDIPTGPAQSRHPLDRFVRAYFEQHDIEWPEPVSDGVFIRRAYLDVIGLLPEPDEVAAFLADASPTKRDALIDALLAREADYAQHWLTFWNDLLRNDYSGTGFITGLAKGEPPGRYPITSWLYDALVRNKAYDDMVRQLVSPDESSEGFIKGIQWRGAVNASQRTEMQAAQNISQSLMGLNLKCASCHDSFVSNLTLDQAYAFANIFADSDLQIARCDIPTGRMARTGFIYPELGDVDGTLPKEERLKQLAAVLTSTKNGRLYRTIANRYWKQLVGRGLIEPVDEMDNLPWSQDALDWLAADLMEHDYDLKHLLRTILTSETYQFPSVGLEDAADATSEDFIFHGPLRRRLSAEQFADALSQTLGPVYSAVAFDPSDDVGTEAQWIWFDVRQNGRPALPAAGTYYFRHSFNLPVTRRVAEASLLVSVDHSFRLFVNGDLVAEGRDWRQVQRIDVTDRLKAGSNLLAIQGENAGAVPNPAGILLDMRVTLTDGTVLNVTSNEAWKASDQPAPEAWQQPAFDDQSWQAVRVVENPGRPAKKGFVPLNWGRLVAFTHEPDEHRLPFARASLVQNDPFLEALGRPARDNVVTSRTSEATLLQALELMNGPFLDEAVARGARHWLGHYPSAPKEMVQQIYLQALGRPPVDREMEAAQSALGPKPSVESVQDLLWALVLLPEFQIIY
ncbi:MAG: DUF1553 domain-containing protein [Luteitalea sp.]|nr:DUF1553 domain-containing protein [Luteitalea sp.]